MSMPRHLLLPVLLVVCSVYWGESPRTQSPRALFAFATNDVWLNLHHYLYVLGRAHAGMPDAKQPAVASALEDERQGLAALSEADRAAWGAAVGEYANGLSRQPSFFQVPLAPVSLGLASTGDTEAFPLLSGDPATRATLERAAPLYRKAWWPQHRAMNERYIAQLERQMDADGETIAAFLSRAYQLDWPGKPYPTHVVAYANWQGAFSYTGRLMILSSNANSTNDRWYPLESVFHEGMHQWDDRVQSALRAEAMRQGVMVPPDLSHVLLFVTVGEAIRRLHPDHVPVIESLDLWRGTLSGASLPAARLRPAIQNIWKPHLGGKGTRDEAFARMVAAAAAATK